MDIAKSDIVKSTAGRDAGKCFFVLATEGDFLLLAGDDVEEALQVLHEDVDFADEGRLHAREARGER